MPKIRDCSNNLLRLTFRGNHGLVGRSSGPACLRTRLLDGSQDESSAGFVRVDSLWRRATTCKVPDELTALTCTVAVVPCQLSDTKRNEEVTKYTSKSRSSSREVRVRVPFFSVVYFSRGILPQKRGEKGNYWGTLK